MEALRRVRWQTVDVADPVRLLLVGSNGAVRRGLELLFSSEEHVEIVGQVDDVRSAIRLGRKVRPAVVLVDLEPLGKRGVREAAQMKRALSAEVAVLTLRDDGSIRRDAEQAGLHFLSKQADTGSLLAILRSNHPSS